MLASGLNIDNTTEAKFGVAENFSGLYYFCKLCAVSGGPYLHDSRNVTLNGR